MEPRADLRRLKQRIHGILHVAASAAERVGDGRRRQRREHRCELRDCLRRVRRCMPTQAVLRRRQSIFWYDSSCPDPI
jgi:hypothetical protein